MSYVFDPITGTFVYQSQFPEAPDFRRPGAPNYRLPEPPQDETIMYEQPLVPQRPVAVSPVSPRDWTPPRREFGMTEAEALPPISPSPGPELRSQPWAGPTNFYERYLAGPWAPSGMFGQRSIRGDGPVATIPDNILAEGAQPSPPALSDAALASSTTEPPAGTQPDAAAAPPPAQPPAAAPTQPAQPPAAPAATPPAAPAPSPVTAALGAPGQPAVDPNARLRDLTARFEVGGVRGDPYFTPNGAGSSAFGRYQITRPHYETLRTRFPQERLPDWEEFRRNPAVQDRAMDLSTQYYQNEAQRRGFEYTDTTHLGMHFLGVEGFSNMARALRENPNAPVSSVVSQQAVEQNGNIFRDERGNVRTVQDAYNQMQARFNGERGGALTAANGGTADQRTNAAATNPTAATAPQETNPYRDRLLQLLTSIEGERNSRPDTGELLLRMGAGILSGRDLMDGMGRGGAAVAELMQQTRQDNARRDQTLVGGFQGLVNDRRLQQQRDTFGAPTSIRWIGRDGREVIRAGRVVNGDTLLQNDRGEWVPAFQVTGTNDWRPTSRGDTTLGERGWQGIPNARDGSVIDTLPDGRQIVEPSFELQGVEANRLFLQTRNLISSGIRLDQMERAGVDPARFSQAITSAVARTPQGANVATIAAEFARLAGITDEEARIYTINSLRYLNAAGRISSGAAITRDEWGRFEGEAVARYGDTSGVLEELRTTRNSVMRAAASSQGPASQFLMGAIRGDYLLDRPFERRQSGGGQPRPPAQAQPPAAPAAQGTTGGVNWSIRPSN